MLRKLSMILAVGAVLAALTTEASAARWGFRGGWGRPYAHFGYGGWRHGWWGYGGGLGYYGSGNPDWDYSYYDYPSYDLGYYGSAYPSYYGRTVVAPRCSC